ncbi:MAG: hypothetical protein HKN92_05495 [Chitinophagales bacterium]|nr:hypothetical protein [Chitinophagales bacterium]
MKKIIPFEISGVHIAIAIFILLGAAFGIYQFNKKPKQVSDIKTAFVITADELYDAFEQNENEASAKYIDKVIEVSGVISEVDRNNEGNMAIVMKAKNALLGGVNAAMGQKDNLKLTIGEDIKLKCMCVGYNMEVILNNCVPVE